MTQPNLLFLSMVLVASIALLAGLGLVVYREAQRSLAFDRRLGVPRHLALAAGVGASAQGRRAGNASGGLRVFAHALLRAFSLLAPVGAAEREKLAGLLRAAGFGQRDALSVFLSVKLAVALVGAAAAGARATGTALGEAYGLLVALAVFAGFVVGGIVPEYALRWLKARRAQRMGTALPDALDLTVMCLESGLTFERTIATVASELEPIEPALAAELRTMETELRVSADRRAVLLAFHARTEVEGLRDLAMTLIQSERYGTPLTQSMKNIAAGERTARAARIETQAQRLPVLMTLPMLLFVVPGTMCLIAGPPFLTALGALGALGGQ